MCRAKFSMITRQHHCRACGFIFCWQCAPHRSISHEQLPYARYEEAEQKMHTLAQSADGFPLLINN
ncbi:MAG: FYVE zinc finger domain-containing protein [Promethearchaeia archaeon]